MADPVIPKNQQDSFPVQTVASSLQPDQIIIAGAQVFRYWSPTGLGFSTPATVTNDATGENYVLSPFIDASGCRVFNCIVKRLATVAPTANLPACNLWIQYRLSNAETPPASMVIAGSINNQYNNRSLVNTTGIVFPADNANFANQRVAISWEGGNVAGSSAVIAPVVCGWGARFILSWSTNNPNGANMGGPNQFQMAIYGSS